MLNLNKLIVLCLVSFFSNPMLAQIQKCGTTDYLQTRLIEDPNLQVIIDQEKAETQLYLKNIHPQKSNTSGVYRIPVVVHLIGSSLYSYYSPQQGTVVANLITELNDDFRKKMGTAGDGQGVDTEIEFCLAKEDPWGQVTTGVTVTSGNFAAWDHSAVSTAPNSDLALKNLIHWNPDEYLNIYIVQDLINLEGYASSPTTFSSYPNLDGVVINQLYFNIGERTLTHEIGHWLGLLHTWGVIEVGNLILDGDCGADDGIDDTPICDGPYYSTNIFNCPAPNQCTTENQNEFSTDQRQIENYMDYSDKSCMNMFTEGQKELMIGTLFTQRAIIWNTQHAECPAPNHCNNGILDQGEIDVDCGGDCKPCSYLPSPGGGIGCYTRLSTDGFYIDGSLDLIKEVCLPFITVASIPALDPNCSQRFNKSNGKLFIAVTLVNENLIPISPEFSHWVKPIMQPVQYDVFNLIFYLPFDPAFLIPGQIYKVKIATARWSWQEFTKYIRIYDNSNRTFNGKTINSSVYGGDNINILNSTVKPTPVTQPNFIHNIEIVARKSIVISQNTTFYPGATYKIDNFQCLDLSSRESGGKYYSKNGLHDYISEEPHDIYYSNKEPETAKNDFSIYPNPSNGQFNIAIENNDDVALVEVYDLMGKKVFMEHNIKGQFVVNIEGQPKGIYFVKVTIGNEVFNEKIVYQ